MPVRAPVARPPRPWEKVVSGCLDVLGGHVDPGEEPEAALRRELQEELGIQATVGEQIARYSYQYPGRSAIELIFYRIAEFEGEPRNLAFERIVWETASRLTEYDFLDGDIDFVKNLTGGQIFD